jgi:DNA-binding transcriptional LysR family regulator
MGQALHQAIQNLTTPVQVSGAAVRIDLANVDWEGLRLFAVAADQHSFKAGARIARCSINTLRHSVETLEHRVGQALFRRSHLGVELTKAGELLYAQVNDMRLRGVEGGCGADAMLQANAPNEVRLSVTEGLGTFWIVPRMAEFQAERPDLRLKLECKMEVVDIRSHACDIAVQLESPVDPQLVRVRLGTMHLMPFASQDYVALHGVPSTVEEAFEHRFVVQVADQVRSDLFELFAGSSVPPNLIAMEANTSSAHYWAIARGVGIGILPTYARAITKRVIPIDMEIKLRRDIWLVYHPDIKRSKLHMEAVAWLRAAFDPIRYPWFANEFVHPSHFEDDFERATVVRMFAGFMDG